MKVTIDTTLLGPDHPCYIVAELSGNHAGSLEHAKTLIRKAKQAGANAVKLQTYTADTITLNSTKPDFSIPESDPWHHKKTLHALYQEAHTPWDWHEALFAEAKQEGITLFSSPFDISSVDFLESLDCPAYKIASPEITDIPLLKKVAQTKKPVIVSTGLAELNDLELAVTTLKKNGCNDLILLKCTASYPAKPNTMNLKTIPDLASRFECLSGLSDHSLGIGIPIAAVCLGARFIEKHFMLDAVNSVDSFFSLNPHDFKHMVDEIRTIESALGCVSYNPPGGPDKYRARRSLYVASSIQKGTIFEPKHIKSVRPSYGLHPKYFETIIGKKATRDLETGDRLCLSDIQGLHNDDS